MNANINVHLRQVLNNLCILENTKYCDCSESRMLHPIHKLIDRFTVAHFHFAIYLKKSIQVLEPFQTISI